MLKIRVSQGAIKRTFQSRIRDKTKKLENNSASRKTHQNRIKNVQLRTGTEYKASLKKKIGNKGNSKMKKLDSSEFNCRKQRPSRKNRASGLVRLPCGRTNRPTARKSWFISLNQSSFVDTRSQFYFIWFSNL